jgi:hypothetical protein
VLLLPKALNARFNVVLGNGTVRRNHALSPRTFMAVIGTPAVVGAPDFDGLPCEAAAATLLLPGVN